MGGSNDTFKNICKVNQQVKCGKYRIDYTIKNIAIECDEYNHKDRNKLYEIERENFIKSHGYKIIRYNPDDENSNIFTLINEILISLCERHDIDVGKVINEINASNIKQFK